MLTKRLDEESRKRIRAGRLLQKGKKPAEIAHAAGVARQTVYWWKYGWKKVFDEGGIDALRDMAAPERPARLQAWQLEELARALLNKPSAYGFETELWTLKRVGALVHRLYGVRFGLTNIWLILGALGFSRGSAGIHVKNRRNRPKSLSPLVFSPPSLRSGYHLLAALSRSV